MAWNYPGIRAEQTKLATRYEGMSREELIERIIDLETAAYPFWVALSPITDKSWRGTNATSKLFPLRPEADEDAYYVYNAETKKSDVVKLAEVDLSKTEYYLSDSINIDDGSRLADDFSIIAFHQQGPGAYISCGDISIEDVKSIGNALHGNAEVARTGLSRSTP